MKFIALSLLALSGSIDAFAPTAFTARAGESSTEHFPFGRGGDRQASALLPPVLQPQRTSSTFLLPTLLFTTLKITCVHFLIPTMLFYAPSSISRHHSPPPTRVPQTGRSPLTPLRAVDEATPPAIVRSGEPSDIRYSDFVNSVKSDKLEKVTFSSDGTRLLAIDTDGQRLKIDALPNDPELLSMLTQHKVDVTVLPAQQASGAGEVRQLFLLRWHRVLCCCHT